MFSSISLRLKLYENVKFAKNKMIPPELSYTPSVVCHMRELKLPSRIWQHSTITKLGAAALWPY